MQAQAPHFDNNPTQAIPPIPVAPPPPAPPIGSVPMRMPEPRPPRSWLQYAIFAVALIGWMLAVWQAVRTGAPIPLPPDALIVNQGWVDDTAEVRDVVASLPEGQRHFGDTPAGRASLGPDEDVYLWDLARQLTGSPIPPRNQGAVGSCVAFATASAVEHLLCVQIAHDTKEGRPFGSFKALSTEVIYGGSRVEVGGNRVRGDGSVGAWAAEWCRKWGVVKRGVHGSHDLREYNEALCRQYGSRGVPDDLEPTAKESPVKSVTLVRSAAEAAKALRQGYPLMVCSNQGFSMQRDSQGFAAPQGQWAHAMCINGYTHSPRRGFHIENSWGPDAHRGPQGPGNPGTAGFWADYNVVDRMLSQGDSWAFSDAVGFPSRSIDWFVKSPRRHQPALFALHPFGG
jgi:hypothetical protein